MKNSFTRAILATSLSLPPMAVAAPDAYPTLDAREFGLVGDGVTDNQVAFQALFAAAASGGIIRFPCGVFKYTTKAPTVTIAGGKAFGLEGAPGGCTVIYASGAPGPKISYANQWVKGSITDLTIETDQPGVHDGLTLDGPYVNANPAVGMPTAIRDVIFIGSNTSSGGGDYWAHGLQLEGVSNVVAHGVTYFGHDNRGVGVRFAGNIGAKGYAVVASFTDYIATGCATAFYEDDWTQGVTLLNANVTGCGKGLETVAKAAGQLSQVQILGGQYYTWTCGVCMDDVTGAGTYVQDAMFIVPTNAKAIRVAGTQYTVTGNNISATGDNKNSVGVYVKNGTYQGGLIDNNHFMDLAAGVFVAPGESAPVQISNNKWSGNSVDIVAKGVVSGLLIHDFQARNMSTLLAIGCGPFDKYSTFAVADSPTATFNATLTAGGGANFVGAKCDGSRFYVD